MQCPIWCTDRACNWRQRPDWCTVWEAVSSGLYIVGTTLLCQCPHCLRTERNSRLLTKEQSQSWRSTPCWTTKVHYLLTGFGKDQGNSMLQSAHPLSFFLGGGWFKLRWLKTPGAPARTYCQQVTAGNLYGGYQTSHRLVTADGFQLGPGLWCQLLCCASLQPFEHRTCDAQPCRFWRAAYLTSPEDAHCGRTSGTTCPLSLLGDVGCSLQCVPGAAMRKCLRQQCCHLKAWNTGDAENAFCSTIWRILPTRTTTLGSTLRRVL
eukprot:964601-Amphidinium_carterae.2